MYRGISFFVKFDFTFRIWGWNRHRPHTPVMLTPRKKTILLYYSVFGLNFVIYEGQFTIFDEKRGHFRGTKNDLLSLISILTLLSTYLPNAVKFFRRCTSMRMNRAALLHKHGMKGESNVFAKSDVFLSKFGWWMSFKSTTNPQWVPKCQLICIGHVLFFCFSAVTSQSNQFPTPLFWFSGFSLPFKNALCLFNAVNRPDHWSVANKCRSGEGLPNALNDQSGRIRPRE